MKTYGKVFLGIVALALGLGVTGPAWASELPGRKWSQRCQRCGKALTGASIPAPPPPNWPSNSGIAYPGRCCPPSAILPAVDGPRDAEHAGYGTRNGADEPRRCLPPCTGAPAMRRRRRPRPEAAPPAAPLRGGRPPAATPPPSLGAAEPAPPALASGLGGGLGGAEWRIGDVRRHRSVRPPGPHQPAQDAQLPRLRRSPRRIRGPISPATPTGSTPGTSRTPGISRRSSCPACGGSRSPTTRPRCP